MNMGTLHFETKNPSGTQTILLLHGAFSSHHEWDLVAATPHLSQYHLLIPDLPSHGRSTSKSIPFNVADTAGLLAQLITEHAKDGKADVVGMSLGGYVAIYMAQRYPDVIGQGGLFVSGCGRPWPQPSGVMMWASGLVMFLGA
jgi:pimeloyl-ACP methyl ester carboxylesterase